MNKKQMSNAHQTNYPWTTRMYKLTHSLPEISIPAQIERMMLIILMTTVSILVSACGGGSGPEPVVMTPAAPTVEPTATPVPTEPPATTATPTAQPEPDVEDETTTVGITTAQTLTTTDVATVGEVTAAESPSNCAVESDLDLVGYPELQDTMGCAVAPASYADVAINEFGEGPEFDRFMLWFSTNQLIYVLLPDETWQAYEDEWSEDEPEILCNPLDGEATSPPLPRRGFGKLWCSDETLQETLGTIPREERLCQHAVTQQFETGQLLACFEDATIRYFRILEDGTWDMIFVQ